MHLVHSALSLFFLHWRKGSPFQDHGQYHQLTFWEQLDHGEQNTDNRKFFAAAPAATAACASAACASAFLFVQEDPREN